MTGEPMGMAEEFLKVTEELDSASSRTRAMASRRAALADGLVFTYGVHNAAKMVDQTPANMMYLAARWRFEKGLEEDDDYQR